MRNRSLVDELIAERGIEELREYRRDRLEDFIEQPRVRDVASRIYVGLAKPTRNRGRPHKSRIAEEAGVNRIIFYKDPTANFLVNEYIDRGDV